MIILNDISKNYGEKTVIGSLSAEFDPHRRYAIMGPSGCGKTTLFRLISGLEAPDSGSISGLENSKISAVFQNDRLCGNLSAYANVKIVCGKEVSKNDILSALARVGLENDAYKNADSLSGGMKRRCAIVRALLSDYDLLLLDEPFNGLDNAAKQVTADYINEKSGDRGMIMITHNEAEAKLLDCETLTLFKH